jgi:hypothetical protein
MHNDNNSGGVTGREAGADSEMVWVPHRPTRAMVESAWAEAHYEDAEGVWDVMIKAYESMGNSSTGSGWFFLFLNSKKRFITVHARL